MKKEKRICRTCKQKFNVEREVIAIKMIGTKQQRKTEYYSDEGVCFKPQKSKQGAWFCNDCWNFMIKDQRAHWKEIKGND